MTDKALIEKFIEEEISEAETLDLFQEMTSNSEMTDELQQGLYMDELMEQSFKEDKSAEAFISSLTEKLQNENKAVKMRTGQFNKLTTGAYRVPSVKKKNKKSPAPILIFSAIAACLAIGLTILVVKNHNTSVASGTSVAGASGPEVSSNLYIQDLKGSVSVRRNGKVTELQEGDFIIKGDVLTAGSDSTGSLQFISENTKITLKPNSRFSIESDIGKGERDKVFNVREGRVYFDVAHQKDGFNFSIKSTKADSRIIGTRLEVSSLSDSTTVKVFEGLVRVKSKLSGDVLDVPGNHYVNIMDSSFPNIRRISGSTPKVIGFSLVNATSDKLVKGFEILKDGMILKKSEIPRAISIRINATNNESIHGVRIILKDSQGNKVRFKNAKNRESFVGEFEKVLPYTMTCDTVAGDYNEWEPAPGEYLLEVEVLNIDMHKTDSASLTFTVQ